MSVNASIKSDTTNRHKRKRMSVVKLCINKGSIGKLIKLVMHHKSTPVDPLKLTSDKRGINEKYISAI